MDYVIKRTDQGGGYLARAGSQHSFTKFLQEARVFKSREAAQVEVCPQNEYVLSIEEAVRQ